MVKATVISILTVGTIIGMAIWGPWALVVGLGLAFVGGAIEGRREQ